MSTVDRILDISYHNLSRLYDEADGGFFFNINKNGYVNEQKTLRYNARVIELLNGYYDANRLRSTASCVVASFSVLNNNCLGDIGLLITALNKLGCYSDIACMLENRLYSQSMDDLKRIVPDRVLWLLEACDIPELKSYVLENRELRHKYFGFDYVCVSAVLYAIHYLVVKELYEEAVIWYRFLIDKFFLDSGEWLLSYFPLLHWMYRKAFSVHQLGMAPLYLLELYERVHEESILPIVKKSVNFGLRFLNGDRVYRNLKNKETRSYECAFDIRGLLKAREFNLV